MASFWHKKLANLNAFFAPVNLRRKSGAISSFICRSGADISVFVCVMVIQMVIHISSELSSKICLKIGQDLLRQVSDPIELVQETLFTHDIF